VGATSKKDKVHITITIKNEDTANRLVLREIDEARARPVAVLNSSQSEANRKIYKKHNKEEEEEKVDSFQNFCECLRDFFRYSRKGPEGFQVSTESSVGSF
jgi:hypothetical protein